MRIFKSCFFGAWTTLSLCPSHVLPLSTSNSTTDQNPLPPTSQVTCLPPSGWATTNDCLRAILLFGELEGRGTFSKHGQGGPFTLPQFRTYGSCSVVVTIAMELQDVSSWLYIAHVASLIAPICARGEYPLGTTAGTMNVGQSGRIRVTLGNRISSSPDFTEDHNVKDTIDVS